VDSLMKYCARIPLLRHPWRPNPARALPMFTRRQDASSRADHRRSTRGRTMLCNVG
jgi:hypothetical protein